jgi:hypothetical protein
MTDQERVQHIYDLLKEAIREFQEGRLPPSVTLAVLQDIQADMVILGAEPVAKEAPTVDWSYPVISQGRTR